MSWLIAWRIATLVLAADALSAVLVARLFLASLAHNALVVSAGSGGRLRHPLLSTVLAALILPTFEIVLFGHRLFSLTHAMLWQAEFLTA
jgi:hypothetical protein